MADRYDKVLLLRMGSVAVSVVMCLVPLAGSFWWLLALFVLLGMSEAIIWPVLGALATQEGRQYGQGTMMGVYSLAMSTGVFMGAMGAGVSMDQLGLKWSFINVGIVVLILTMAAAWLIRTGSVHRVTGNE